jgi:hypothetical protein
MGKGRQPLLGKQKIYSKKFEKSCKNSLGSTIWVSREQGQAKGKAVKKITYSDFLMA